MAVEGKREIHGIEVPTQVFEDGTELLTIEGANLDKIKDRMGLRRAHKEVRCVAPPIGCGREIPAEEFAEWDPVSTREYAMSGLCRTPCQAKAFDESECTCDSPCCSADLGVGVVDCGKQHCPVHGEHVSWMVEGDGPTPPNDNLVPEELVR